jgi:DNA gyrase/topoisomerase IV subunit A
VTRVSVVSRVGQPPSEEERPRVRLSVLDAYLLAVERRAEVMEALAEAGDPDDARRSVADLLDVTEAAASAVLDARLRTFSKSEIARIRVEREDIQGLLDRGP